MIRSFQIKNYAIIEELEIAFDHSLNIVTGETGAGKSIILGAFSLLMGKRADSKVLFNAEQKCFIEAIFDKLSPAIYQILEEEELDQEDDLIIRREIQPSGKSRAFVNDSPVNLGVLQKLSIHLADLNQQFELLEIQNSDFHIRMLDAISGNTEALKAYQKDFINYKNKSKRLNELNRLSAAAAKERDFIEFQLNELHTAELIEEEEITLEQEQERLSSTKELQDLVRETSFLLEESEQNVIDLLNGILFKWEKYKDLDPKLGDLCSDYASAIEQIKEISLQSKAYEASLNANPGRLEEITGRLDQIFKLHNKHQVKSNEALLEIQGDLEEQLKAFSSNEAETDMLTKEIEELEKTLRKHAGELRKRRKDHITKLETEINDRLRLLAMPFAKVQLQLESVDELTKYGLDTAEILFASNKGAEFMPIKKIASGGEIARLMLCMKSSVAHELDMPSLVFDEIDSGVSGEVALKMGKLLSQLAKTHQLIVITHSPQVASKAHKHFHIFKEELEERSVTRVKILSKDQRIVELAKMLSGDPPSNSAISNAKELIRLN